MGHDREPGRIERAEDKLNIVSIIGAGTILAAATGYAVGSLTESALAQHFHVVQGIILIAGIPLSNAGIWGALLTTSATSMITGAFVAREHFRNKREAAERRRRS